MEQLLERRCGRVAMAACPAGAAQRLDRVERLLPLEPQDDAAERGGEPADVLVEGNVLTPDRRPRKRDGAHRRGGSGPARPRLTGLVRRVRQVRLRGLWSVCGVAFIL